MMASVYQQYHYDKPDQLNSRKSLDQDPGIQFTLGMVAIVVTEPPHMEQWLSESGQFIFQSPTATVSSFTKLVKEAMADHGRRHFAVARYKFRIVFLWKSFLTSSKNDDLNGVVETLWDACKAKLIECMEYSESEVPFVDRSIKASVVPNNIPYKALADSVKSVLAGKFEENTKLPMDITKKLIADSKARRFWNEFMERADYIMSIRCFCNRELTHLMRTHLFDSPAIVCFKAHADLLKQVESSQVENHHGGDIDVQRGNIMIRMVMYHLLAFQDGTATVDQVLKTVQDYRRLDLKKGGPFHDCISGQLPPVLKHKVAMINDPTLDISYQQSQADRLWQDYMRSECPEVARTLVQHLMSVLLGLDSLVRLGTYDREDRKVLNQMSAANYRLTAILANQHDTGFIDYSPVKYGDCGWQPFYCARRCQSPSGKFDPEDVDLTVALCLLYEKRHFSDFMVKRELKALREMGFAEDEPIVEQLRAISYQREYLYELTYMYDRVLPDVLEADQEEDLFLTETFEHCGHRPADFFLSCMDSAEAMASAHRWAALPYARILGHIGAAWRRGRMKQRPRVCDFYTAVMGGCYGDD